MIRLLKNVMVARGLLQVVAFGAGALSIDNRSAKGGAGEIMRMRRSARDSEPGEAG